MGDTTDGSSNAAHRAQDPRQHARRGFFARVFGAISPTETDVTDEDAQRAPLNGLKPAHGLGNLRRMRQSQQQM
jgi:magnesium and cobalt transporter